MRRAQLKPHPCAYCPCRAATRCEMPGCDLPMCAKHTTKKAGGKLCREHKDAQLVQETGVPATRFRDAGVARPHQEAP